MRRLKDVFSFLFTELSGLAIAMIILCVFALGFIVGCLYIGWLYTSTLETLNDMIMAASNLTAGRITP